MIGIYELLRNTNKLGAFMIHNEKIISALEFAENCIKLVTNTQGDFLRIRQYYRENKFCIESLTYSEKEMPEYIISRAYEYFRFGCHQENVFFYKEYDKHKIQITDQASINTSINKLFKCKGILNGELIYLSKNAYDILILTKENCAYNPLKNDSFMLKCYNQLVESILKSLNTTTVPPLKENTLNSYIDNLFPPTEYANSNFSLNKKQALIYLFEKTR